MPIVEQGHGVKQRRESSQSVCIIEQYVTTGAPFHKKTRGKGVKHSSELFHPRGRRLWYFIPTRGLPWWLSGEESACNAGDVGLIPRSGTFPGGGNGNPLQHSCLGNPMDK